MPSTSAQLSPPLGADLFDNPAVAKRNMLFGPGTFGLNMGVRKVFRFGEPMHCWNPQTHGDFSQFPFWKLDYWDPNVDTDKRVSYARLDESCDPTAEEPVCQ